MKDIWESRRIYKNPPLDILKLPGSPFELFEKWFQTALEKEPFEANAMALVTADKNKQPYARIVLLRKYSSEGFIFFTNYNSDKGLQIRQNKKVALLFFWPSIVRQVRVLGKISKTSSKVSDEYFYSRPIEHQCSSIASNQSQIIYNKESILNNYKECLKKQKIKRPSNWGGYVVKPFYFEFWQGQPNRLHDRFVYKLENNKWTIYQLAP